MDHPTFDFATMSLPENFLEGPAPNLQKSTVDWKEHGLNGYAGAYAVILDGVLTQSECDTLVAAAQSVTGGEWERAMVNVGFGRQVLSPDIRSCGRIIWDDRNTVDKIWKRIEASVPEIHQLPDRPRLGKAHPAYPCPSWKLTRLNERMRFLKYTGGEYFRPHCDGSYITPDADETSHFTLHLYLNDTKGKPDEPPLIGGATSFFLYSANADKRFDVAPKAGRVLIFQHAGLVHSGEEVVSGTKLTMRTDIMYEMVLGKAIDN